MPKVKDKKSKYIKRYDEELLQRALLDIENGLPKKQAAIKYGIPRPTLQYRMSDKFKKVRHGPSSYLTEEEENTLEQWITDSHRKGFPRRRDDIQASVKGFLDDNPRPTSFQNNTPGRHWYKAFLGRHPNLVSRTPEAVTKSSSTVSENDIRNWFYNIEKHLKEKKYFDILQDPTRVYNGDETCFMLCPKEEKVIAPRGARNVYQVDQGTAKANLTVIMTFSAAGAITPPMVIYPYKRLPSNIVNSVPDDWGVGTSDNGWMKSELFFEYISNVLHPHLVKENIQFPIMLFVDGHKTHMTYELSTLCTRLQIILIALYPNATRILQPADVACFKPLKNAWKLSVLKWRRSNPFVQLTKIHFAPIFKEALTNLKTSSISNCFRACGLCPWNADNIDFSKCLGPIIIGPEKLEQIKTVIETASDCESNEDFELLVKIFRRLKKHDDENTLEEANYSIIRIDDFNLTQPEDLNIQTHLTENQINEIPIIFDNSNNATNDQKQDKITLIEQEQTNVHAADISQPSTSDGRKKDIVILDDIDLAFRDNELLFGLLDGHINYETAPNYPDADVGSICQELVVKENVSIYNNEDDKDNDVPECRNTEIVLSTPSTSPSGEVTAMNLHQVYANYSLDSSNLDEISVEGTESKDSNKEMSKYLLWHNTPERSGKRQTERVPFIITCTGWKKIQEDKQTEKLEKERKKEENKRKRELNAATKAKRSRSVKKAPHVRKLTLAMNETENIPITSNEKENAVDRNDSIKKSLDIIETNKVEEKRSEPLRQCSNAAHETDKKENFIEMQNFPPKNNTIMNKGLCFICVKNVSLANFAIKCKNCTRVYHYKCLKRNNLYAENFTCNVCLSKM